MSTYAERWAGYAIEKGTLSVRLKYKIDQGRLEAENQLFLDQLTFGDRVDSPDATKLPVQLAVSLLKNRRGEIDLQLPVAGTLNDPQFSVGGIVWRLLLNLLEKALTAPFSLLFGDGGSESAQVDFAAGATELDAAARDRLDGLAAKLEDRPALKLEVTGHADQVADGAALAAAQAASQAAANKAAPQPAGAASAVAAAPSAIAAAPSASAAAAQEAARRVALQTLADRRADQVMAYLSAKLPPERILITRSVVDGAPPVTDAAGATSAEGPAKGSPGANIRPSVQFKLK
jgi:outer membrane protein OmpA-like peptidoglycan-associated protein